MLRLQAPAGMVAMVLIPGGRCGLVYSPDTKRQLELVVMQAEQFPGPASSAPAPPPCI